MENKYYTPDIEDIKKGYECEMFLPIFENGKWENASYISGTVTSIYPKFEFTDYRDVFHIFHIHEGEYKEFNVRTLYITKEQIENEGWKDGLKCNVDGYAYSVYIIPSTHKIIIKQLFNASFSDAVLFEGECPSINEFRWICKLLNIYK